MFRLVLSTVVLLLLLESNAVAEASTKYITLVVSTRNAYIYKNRSELSEKAPLSYGYSFRISISDYNAEDEWVPHRPVSGLDSIRYFPGWIKSTDLVSGEAFVRDSDWEFRYLINNSEEWIGIYKFSKEGVGKYSIYEEGGYKTFPEEIYVYRYENIIGIGYKDDKSGIDCVSKTIAIHNKNIDKLCPIGNSDNESCSRLLSPSSVLLKDFGQAKFFDPLRPVYWYEQCIADCEGSLRKSKE